MPTRGVMGILNVTPDSFSDGGRFEVIDDAVAHGFALAEAGADVVDVGGESTRPGATAVPADEELRRVVPVVEKLAEAGVVVSIDTTKADVARAALEAGAVLVNDVSAGRFDPSILDVAAARGAGYVAMHMRGQPRTMQDDPHYDDVVGEVGGFLVERVAQARDAGIEPDRILVDPGIGFGKTASHNLELLVRLPELVDRVGQPVLVGASRKSFIGAALDLSVGERDDATLATVIWVFDRGAAMVRVHDARAAARAAALLDVMRRASPEGIRAA